MALLAVDTGHMSNGNVMQGRMRLGKPGESSHANGLAESVWLTAHGGPAITLERDLRCDIAIVGGGYTGLSAAYHLKRRAPALKIAIFEKEVIGQGASGLNSGQCSPRIGAAIEQQVRTIGARRAAACYQYSLDAVAETVGIIETEGIECDLQAGQQWQVALTQSHCDRLTQRSRIYRDLGFSVDTVPMEGVKAMLPGSPKIRGALAFPAYTLDPAKLCAGLKRAVREIGVDIYENSLASRIDLQNRVLQCNGRQVLADRVIIATDGWTPLTGLFRKQIFPIRTFCACTQPLDASAIEAIWKHGLGGIYDSRHVFNFIRITPDRRLLVGGEFHYGDVAAEPSQHLLLQVAAKLAQALAVFFPALRQVRIERIWSGLVGCTLDGWPVITPLDPDRRACFVGAWNGHGVALATASGRMVADCLLDDNWDTGYPWFRQGSFGGVPASSLAKPAISAYLSYQRMQDYIGFSKHRVNEILNNLY